MQLKIPGVSFQDDSRGVSGVVGFIFIFAIIMILISINQSQVVPQENKEIEFQHYQDVRDDMVEVRAAVSEAAEEGTAQYPTVKLGTNYPPRLIAVNPAPPSGQLSTSKPYNITIRDEGKVADNISTRFYEYQNGYNYMDIGSIWLESTGVLYLDARTKSGRIVTIEDQNLIVGDGQAHVNILKGDYSESGTEEVTIEIYPTKNASVTPNEWSDNVTIKIPTRLNESEYWNKTLVSNESATVVEKYYGTVPFENIHQLKFKVKAENIDITTLGTGSAPPTKGSASSEDEFIWIEDIKDREITFVDENNGDLKTLAEDGAITTYDTIEIKGIGQPNADLDGDGDKDVPYVDGGDNLGFVDNNNNKQTLDSSGEVSQAPLGVGDYDGNGTPEVYYVKEDKLYKAEAGSGPVMVYDKNNVVVVGVAGVADFDGDNAIEVVFTNDDNNNNLRLLDDDGDVVKTSTPGVTVDETKAISTPADYDDDGEIEVAAYDDTDKGINLYDSSGEEATFDPPYQVRTSPMGALDYNGDGVSEIIHIHNDNSLRSLDATSGATVEVKDNNSATLRGKESTGVK